MRCGYIQPLKSLVVVLMAAAFSYAGQLNDLGPIACARGVTDFGVGALSNEYSRAYLCSRNDLAAWAAVQLPRGSHFRDIVGGYAGGIFVVTEKDTESAGDPDEAIGELQAIGFDGTVKPLASGIGSHCDFFNDKIGSQMNKGKLLVTVDGGVTWKVAMYHCDDLLDPLADAKWLSSNELLVEKATSTSLFDVGDQGPKCRWNVGVPAGSFAPCGGNGVWLWSSGNTIVLRDRRDGKEVCRTKMEIPTDVASGLAADARRVYAWAKPPLNAKDVTEMIQAAKTQGSFLAIWDWDGSSLKLEQRLQTDLIASVIPATGKIIIVFRSGKVSVLQGTKLSDQPLTVTNVGYSATPPPNDNDLKQQSNNPTVSRLAPKDATVTPDSDNFMPSEQEQADYFSWLKKVSPDDVDKINIEVSGYGDISPRQRCLLVIEKCKKIAASRPSGQPDDHQP